MERVYKTMKHAGGWNIILGIIIIVVGVSTGVISIVNGGKLLKNKSEVIF